MNIIDRVLRCSSLREFMYKTYLHMGFGLVIAFLFSLVGSSFMSPQLCFFTGIGAIFITSMIHNAFYNRSLEELYLLFIVLFIAKGLFLSFIYMVYSNEIIITSLLCSSIVFFSTSIYGYVTKSDLSEYRNLLIAGSIAVLIAMIASLMFGESVRVSVVMVASIVTIGYIAMYTQDIKDMYRHFSRDEEMRKRIAIIGGLTLALKFITLFVYMLRIMQHFSRKK